MKIVFASPLRLIVTLLLITGAYFGIRYINKSKAGSAETQQQEITVEKTDSLVPNPLDLKPLDGKEDTTAVANKPDDKTTPSTVEKPAVKDSVAKVATIPAVTKPVTPKKTPVKSTTVKEPKKDPKKDTKKKKKGERENLEIQF